MKSSIGDHAGRTIKQWPPNERPREKLLHHGAERLSPAELLALVLRTGESRTRRTAIDLARDLLLHFGSLAELARAEPAELCALPGIGPAKAAEIVAACELGRRLAACDVRPGEALTSADRVFAHFRTRFATLRKERFVTLLLDSKNRLLRECLVSEGSLTASLVHPREVFAPVVRESAAAVLLVHNHPSGDPTPSREDLEITRRLREAGELMGVRVLDHVIIGRGCYVSLAERGLLDA